MGKKVDKIRMTPEYKSYGEYFHTLAWEKIKVPLYQRIYSWKYEKQGKQLLNDMIMIAENNNTKDHFLGIMLVKNEEKQTEKECCTLVDGQQRLTTITLILKSLVSSTIKNEFSSIHLFEKEDAIKVRDLFDSIKKNFDKEKDEDKGVISFLETKTRSELFNWEDAFTWLKNVIEKVYLKKDNSEFVLGLQEDELYKAIMNDETKKFKAHPASFMKDTYKKFEEDASKKLKNDKPLEYIKYAISIVVALTNLYLVVIKLDKEHLLERDYQIFNDINSKGKKLEQYELIKAKIMSKNIYLNQEGKEDDLKKLDENFNNRIFKDQYKKIPLSTSLQGSEAFHNRFFAYYIAFYNPMYFRGIVKSMNKKELNTSLENISVDYIDLLKEVFENINKDLKKSNDSFGEHWVSKGEVVFGDKEFKLMENHMSIFSKLLNKDSFKKLLGIKDTIYQEESFFELTPYEKILIGRIMFWRKFKDAKSKPPNNEQKETVKIIKILKLIGKIRSIVGNRPNVEKYPSEINKVISKGNAIKLCQNDNGAIFYDIDLKKCKKNLLTLFKKSSSSQIKVPSKNAFKKALQGNNEEGKDNQWDSAAITFLRMINPHSDLSVKKLSLNKLIPTDHETFIKVKNQTTKKHTSFQLNEKTKSKYSYKQIGNFFFYENMKKIEDRTYYTKRGRILIKAEFNAIKHDDKDINFLALPFLDNEDEKELSYDNICKRTDIITKAIIKEIEKIIGKKVWRDD